MNIVFGRYGFELFLTPKGTILLFVVVMTAIVLKNIRSVASAKREALEIDALKKIFEGDEA